MTVDLIPMLLLSLLLLTTGGTEVQTAELVLGGEHEATSRRGALIVGDAAVTVPLDVDVPGPIHVLGGDTWIRGTVRGDVTQIGGTVTIGDHARVSGTLQHIGGTLVVSPEASIGRRTSVDVVPAEPDPVQRFVPVALVTLLLALVGARWARRRPVALANVGRAAAVHPLISLTVGALVTVTFLSLFVFMAFTLILLPVSLLGLAVGLLALGYGVVALGHLAGRHIPIEPAGAATAAGIVAVMAGLQVLGAIPLIGDLLLIGVVLTGLGAVLLTYFGLREFTPVTLPG